MNEHDHSNPHAIHPPEQPFVPGGDSLLAEQELVGHFLHDPARTFLVCKQARLTVGEFKHVPLRVVYAACYSLQERGHVGGLSDVEEELRRRGDLEQVGGIEELRGHARRINSNTRSAADLAREIADMAVGRQSYELLVAAQRQIEQGGVNNVAQVRELVETLSGVAGRRTGPTSIRKMEGMFASTMGRMIQESTSGTLNPLIVPTGFKLLDYSFGGFLRRGRVTVLLAPPDFGKTTLGTEIFINVGTAEAEPRTRAAGLYLEGQDEDFVQRMIELKTGMSFAGQSKAEGWRQATDVLNAGRFYFEAGGRRHVEELGRYAGFLRDEGVSFLFIDSSECLDVGDFKGDMGVSEQNPAWTYKLQVLKDLAASYKLAILLNAVIDDAATPQRARKLLSGTEGLTDTAALLAYPPDVLETGVEKSSPEALNRRRLHVFHNHNGSLGHVDFTVQPQKFGVMMPVI